jgi:hypothetical protein
MAKRNPMSDEELVAHIELLESQCDWGQESEVEKEQAKALDYYNSRPMGNEVDERSKIISSDVHDVVEGLTPQVLKPFVSSDDIVKFNAEGPEDEEQAQQETDYINYVVTQKGDIFETLLAWVKTGLLQKNGVVKYFWDKTKRAHIERYYGMTDDVYVAMIQDDSIQVIEHTEEIKDVDGIPTLVHDATLRVIEEDGEARYCVVPPEEFRIHRSSTSVNPQKSIFVEHITHKTISSLREMGYEVEDDIADTSNSDPRNNILYTSRTRNDMTMAGGDEGMDKSMREVVYRECYMLVDADGDGMAELRKICVVGATILANDETEEIPFCAWTPELHPFQFHGGCPADETTSIQDAKTGLLRNTLDNIYTANNNRTYVGPHVNVDDFIDNQIGGIVRVNQGTVNEQIKEAQITPIGPVTLPIMELLDSHKEQKTGWTRYNQGTDADSLNKTATGIRLITQAGNERVGLISRSFAELGLKHLMIGIHGLCRRHEKRERMIRLRNKWVPVDPRGWKNRYDMTVSVGLGNADQQMQMQGAQLLLQEQKELAQLTGPQGIVSPGNFYEAAAKLAKSVGEKNPERYFTMPPEPKKGPDGQPLPPEPPDPTQDPEVMFRVKESQQKDREIDLKEREVAIKEAAQELQRKQAIIGGLTEHARMSREFQQSDDEVNSKANDAMKKDDDQASLIQAITDGHNALAQGMQQLASQMAGTNRLITLMIEDQAKPKALRVQKLPDGTFVGSREDVSETIQ